MRPALDPRWDADKVDAGGRAFRGGVAAKRVGAALSMEETCRPIVARPLREVEIRGYPDVRSLEPGVVLGECCVCHLLAGRPGCFARLVPIDVEPHLLR